VIAEISFWEHAQYFSEHQHFTKAVRRHFWSSLELGATTRCDCNGLGCTGRFQVQRFVELVHQVHSAFFTNPHTKCYGQFAVATPGHLTRRTQKEALAAKDGFLCYAFCTTPA